MRFTIEQHIPATADAVQAALVDAAFIEHLGTLPRLGRPDLLDQRTNGDVVVQRVRYRFAGTIDGPARRFIEPEKLTWIEESSHHLAEHRATFRIRPDHYASLLAASGTSRIQPSPGGVWRVIEGDLKVRVPLVGGKAERAIVSGLHDHGAAEADALAGWVAKG